MPTCSQAPKFVITRRLFITPLYPTHQFTNQTIIVTGANKGLGLEAARHFYRLNCARLILAVHNPDKGQAAKADILLSVKRRACSKSDTTTIQVGPLDLRSTGSTIAFADRVKTELDRVDVLVENAAIHTAVFEPVDGGRAGGSGECVEYMPACAVAVAEAAEE
ncbi:hypothetical protein ASPCAL12987 [Aspergillus calidoustus]|uniref:Short-chain dehydrogenase n=1 Tax=Aspergillus calidoustus TaxID=454130 RepID=A0A0U5GBZ1_ASPCI|nr:hypothetical protein ASPCAL12987 [Aspergillus calidoustus]